LQSVTELLRFSRCELLLLEAGSGGRGQSGIPEEEERPPLKAVTRQRLVKTQMAEKTEVCALVNCKVRELMKRLKLLVVTELEEFIKSNYQSKLRL
jgi:hypothetical protein